jgi:hypothetical protein
VVDEHGDPRVHPHVLQPLQCLRPLALAVDRGVEDIAREREADRHEVWLRVDAERRETRHARGLDRPTKRRT